MSWYFTGKPCKHGHIAQRYTPSCACMICKDEIDSSRRAAGKYKEYRSRNKDARSEYQRKWVSENIERHRKYRREWCSSNTERIKAYQAQRKSEGDSDTSRDIADWVKSADKVCFYCDAQCGDNYHLDHLFPLARGGRHRINNMVIACQRCNLRKNAKDPVEFIEKSIEEFWND